jgi:hypothetical protein
MLRGSCTLGVSGFFSDCKNHGVTGFPGLLDIHQTATENPEFRDFSFHQQSTPLIGGQRNVQS